MATSNEYTMAHLKADIERYVESRDDSVAYGDTNATERDHARAVLDDFMAWIDKTEAEKLREELVEARQRIADLDGSNAHLRAERDSLQAQLNKFEQL